VQEKFCGNYLPFGVREEKISMPQMQGQKGKTADIVISNPNFQEKLTGPEPIDHKPLRHPVPLLFSGAAGGFINRHKAKQKSCAETRPGNVQPNRSRALKNPRLRRI
jgi:hypothetical protein